MNGFNPNKIPRSASPEDEKRRTLLDDLFEALPPGYAAQFDAIFELTLSEEEFQQRVRAFNALRAGEEHVPGEEMRTYTEVPVTIGRRSVYLSRDTDGVFSIKEMA